MKLSAYLKRESLSLEEFAHKIGVANAGTVCRYIKRRRIPRPRVMAAITRETGGEVSPSDFYEPA